MNISQSFIIGVLLSLLFVGCGSNDGSSSEVVNSTSNLDEIKTITKRTNDNYEAVNLPILDDISSSPTDTLTVK
jgi:hypothetical protein